MQYQNCLQMFLSIHSTREEAIFHVRIMTHQLFCEGATTLYRQMVRQIFEEIMRGESRREQLEESTTWTMGETLRKLLSKIVQKVLKIQTFYLNKTQVVQVLFPRYGQLLAQEQIQAISNLKTNVSILNNDINYTTPMILKYISNQQKQKLKAELSKLYQVTPQNQLIFDKNDRCNRNEKFFSEPLIQGVNGAKYMNDIHNRYFFHCGGRSNRYVYDILPLDDYSKQLLYSGAGFKSFITSIVTMKSDKQTDSIYVPIESTQEIITQRYDKFQREMQDNNSHISKSLISYNTNYNKFIVRGKNKQLKLTSISSAPHNSLKTPIIIKPSLARNNKVQYSLSELQLKNQTHTEEFKLTQQGNSQQQNRNIRVSTENKILQKYIQENQDRNIIEPIKLKYIANSALPEINSILELIKNERNLKQSMDKLTESQSIDYKYQYQYHNSPKKLTNQDKHEKLVQIKQLPNSNRPQLSVTSSQIQISSQLSSTYNSSAQQNLNNQMMSRQEKNPFTSSKVLTPCVKDLIEQYTLNGKAINRLSIVTLPLNKSDQQSSSQRARILRNPQTSYEFDKPVSRSGINVNEFRIKSRGPTNSNLTSQVGIWTYNTKQNESISNTNKMF